jgi:hypothetical protein
MRKHYYYALQGRFPFLPIGLSPLAGPHSGAALPEHSMKLLPIGAKKKHYRGGITKPRSGGGTTNTPYENDGGCLLRLLGEQ